MSADLKPCRNCSGCGWVCENHPDTPWAGMTNTEECCGGAGAPCPVCNQEMACAGYVYRALEAAQQEAVGGEKLRAFADDLERGEYGNVRFALNERMCCTGHECGCQGSTVGQYLAHELRELIAGGIRAAIAKAGGAS